MRLMLAAALAALFASPAWAQPSHSIQGFVWRDLTPAELASGNALAEKRGKPLLPPPQYDYFNPNVKVVGVPGSRVPATCKSYGYAPPVPPIACMIITTPCVIVLPQDHALVAALLRHEMGHCNGWRHPKPD